MSIRKREWTTKSGTQVAWLVDYNAFDPETRKPKRRTKQFETKREAVAWWEENAPGVRTRKHVPASKDITVSDMADRWIEAVRHGRKERGPAEESTLRQYRYHADTYIVPRIGHRKLGELTRGDIIDFKTGLLASISRALGRKVLVSLKGLLSEALEQEKIAVNVSAGISIGSGQKPPVIIPTIAEVQALLSKLGELAMQAGSKQKAAEAKAWRRYRALIATAIHTGMRAGEIRGLPWSAVDLANGSITVSQRADEWGNVAERTKSKAGRRSIAIPAQLVALLREWKVEAGGHALVFATSNGKPLSLANIYHRAWKPLQLAAGVCDVVKDENGDACRDERGAPLLEPSYRFHDLRHFHASMLIADNANPKDVQVEMGHSSIQITFDLYGHLFTDEEADARRQERSERLSGKLT